MDNPDYGEEGKDSILSTIDALQDPVDMDVAATLGLYDDHSSSLAIPLDTTGMIKSSLTAYPSSSVYLDSMSDLSQPVTSAVSQMDATGAMQAFPLEANTEAAEITAGSAPPSGLREAIPKSSLTTHSVMSIQEEATNKTNSPDLVSEVNETVVSSDIVIEMEVYKNELSYPKIYEEDVKQTDSTSDGISLVNYFSDIKRENELGGAISDFSMAYSLSPQIDNLSTGTHLTESGAQSVVVPGNVGGTSLSSVEVPGSVGGTSLSSLSSLTAQSVVVPGSVGGTNLSSLLQNKMDSQNLPPSVSSNSGLQTTMNTASEPNNQAQEALSSRLLNSQGDISLSGVGGGGGCDSSGVGRVDGGAPDETIAGFSTQDIINLLFPEVLSSAIEDGSSGNNPASLHMEMDARTLFSSQQLQSSTPLSSTSIEPLPSSMPSLTSTGITPSTISPPPQSDTPALQQSEATSFDHSTTPKGLNLPLLQFLQLNFPALKLDSFKDIFQVNTLLAHTLQQQQQVQEQIKQTTQQLQHQQHLRELKKQHGSSAGVSMTIGGGGVGSNLAASPSNILNLGTSGSLCQDAPIGSLSPGVKLGGGGGSAGTTIKLGGGVGAGSGSGVGGGSVKLGGGGIANSTTTVKLGGGGSSGTTIKLGGSSGISTAVNLSRGGGTRTPSRGGIVGTPINFGKVSGTGTPINVSKLAATSRSMGASPGSSLKAPISEQQQSADSVGNRTPVFAQILANMRQQQQQGLLNSNVTSTSGILPKTQSKPSSFNSPKDGKALTSPNPYPRMSGTRRGAGGINSTPRTSTTTRGPSRLLSSKLSQTLIEHEEAGSTDIVDVGEPFQLLELPVHLKDHCYSRYNPEEGEKLSQSKPKNLRINSSIPPARVSYAPKVPDSPTTLYKLLKITPRKTTRRSSVAASSSSSRTSGASKSTRTHSKKGRFAPSGGMSGRNRRLGRGRVVGSRGSSNPSSRAGSETEEASMSSSDQSDNGYGDDASLKNKRNSKRRSQRTAGQRKRYVDDLNIAFSDEEMQESIMNPRPLTKKEYRGYGAEDDWEYDDHVGGGTLNQGIRSSKHKTKTVSVNLTQGFQYSDIYFEPPAEEANLVEKILLVRTRETKTEEERKKYGDKVEEFLVKYKNYSYLHANWATFDKILVGDKRFDGKVKRYKAKMASLGAFANLDDEPFNPEYTVVDRILDVTTQTEPNNEVVTHYLVKWRSLPYEDATWELEEDVDGESIRKFNLLQILPHEEEREFKPRPPPNAFKTLKDVRKYKDGNKLRPYQVEGVNWMLFNWYARQNCILADEMGLGKTVQSIGLFLEVMRAGIGGPFLVIAPLSTITNWEREFHAWSDFNVIVYHGSAYSRKLIHEYELYYRNPDGSVIPDAFKFDVIITTYEVMMSDESELQAIQWRVVIIDEAHRLKNRNCKLLEELKSLDMEHRVLLTGTPLQNSIEELFSLLNFLEPSTFTSHVAFLQQFGDLKTEEQVEQLKGILKPMMLRRLKEDVEKNIAPKEETIVEVELTVIQKQYYRAILERNFTFLSRTSSSGGVTVPSLLNVMMELRKCCNHPYLIQGAELKIVQDYQLRYPTNHPSSALVQASGKMVLIDKLLIKLKESGHKVLIFSQMVRCLDILEDFLRLKGYFYERIDGNVRGIHRQEAIDRFSKPNSDRFVFLLCTRAGGLGINLTAADTVIIYDSDWNPQNDLQAQARCHRIGQNKSVKIYRLITRNTYERDMFDRASLKLGLDRAVLQSMQQSTGVSGNGAPQLSKKEVEDLLRKGAYGAIMDEDDDANKFCEEDIDQILERRAHVIQLESEGKGSTFSKASFAADGSSDINVDDPDFWQKWAAKANLDLDELANKDSLVLDTPRLRRQVRRYGNDSVEEIVEMNEAIDEVLDLIPSIGKHGWTKLECLKVEKGLLVYGWKEWKNIVRYGKFRKRKLGLRDVENITRNILMYCMSHFTGDDRVPPYLLRLLDPSVVTEYPSPDESFYYDFSSEDFQALKRKDPEELFQDVTYRKHLRRHSNKILLRTRQLHIMRWNMFVDHMEDIKNGAPAKSLGLDLPKPEEPPPASWWHTECDYSLLVGIVKHGYEQFGLMRSDPALCFKAMCGEEPPGSKKKKKSLAKMALVTAKATGGVTRRVSVGGDDSEGSESGEESEGDGDSGPCTPATPNSKRFTRSSNNTPAHKSGGFLAWPSLAEVNTRARRYVSAWIRYQRKEEIKQAHILKEREKKEKFAEASRKKELKKAELAQKWSKREEQDFARVVTFFGVEFNKATNKYDWTKFRQLANLNKKSDERLTLYFHDFKQMCWRVLRKKTIKKGVSGMKVEPISEEKASRCLQRINLLSTIREEILPHDEFNELIKLCEVSFEVPQWWLPGVHDTDLLIGVVKHGIYRSDQLIYGDSELSFKETIPQTSLFDPTLNQAIQEYSGGSDDDEEREGEEEERRIRGGAEAGGEGDEEGDEPGKTHSAHPSLVLPLGWPKEKAIVIRMTRIVYAFRNRVWPKPMEGLDLFTPVVKFDGSSSESSEEEEEVNVEDNFEEGSDSDYQVSTPKERSKRPRKAKAAGSSSYHLHNEDTGMKNEVRTFEIERSQGLKMTLKKSTQDSTEPKEFSIKIPLIQLSFASTAGMKRIPKKRPAPSSSSETSSPLSGAPEAKKRRQEAKNAYFKIVDPKEISFTELTGHERVGVINRNTDEKLPPRQSPMLKNLRLWLEGHPHFNVEAEWGPLIIEWGALKPEMYYRILQPPGMGDTTSSPPPPPPPPPPSQASLPPPPPIKSEEPDHHE